MGALCLLPPGKGALCEGTCGHEACRLVREIAARPCMLCSKELGFGVPVYCYESRLGHADGFDDAHEKALQRFVEALARFAADLYLQGNLPIVNDDTAAVAVEQPRRRKARRRLTATADSSDQHASRRYLLPEFDIQAEIPHGRRRKGRKTRLLEQHHHLLWPGDAEAVREIESS